MWNSQLIRYAGYTQPGGSIVGDPAGVEFTQVKQDLPFKESESDCSLLLPLIYFEQSYFVASRGIEVPLSLLSYQIALPLLSSRTLRRAI